MNKNKIFSLIVFIVLILGVLGTLKFRLDLTQEKRYTLADNTINLLKSVQKPVTVDVYLDGDFPASFKQLQNETKFMLEEFRRINPKISFKFIDPIGQKISQDTLMAMGLQPSVLPDVKDGKVSEIVVFPYAVIKYKDRGTSVPLILQQQGLSAGEQMQKSIENLEYNLVSSVKSLITNKTKNIGVLINQDELRPDEFQVFMDMALENYKAYPIIPKNGKDLTLADEPTLKSTQALVIAKPRKAFTDEEKVLIDQYIMSGGKTLWMIDAVNAEMDSLTRSKRITAYPVDANLTDLFFSYGIRINPGLVKDLQRPALLRLVTGEVAGNPQYMSLPWPYFPLGVSDNKNPITRNINPVKFEFATSIDTLGRKGIKTKVLYESSEKTIQKQVPSLIDLKEIASVDSLAMSEKASAPKIFAVALEGKFPSAYASRSERTKFPNFRPISPDNKMIVIADGDIARNKTYKGQPLPLGVDVLTNQQFGNDQFLKNALDYLLDDSNMIDLRNRNIEARLLDRQAIDEDRSYWQWFNLLLPMLILAILGSVFYFIRKKKFA